MFLVTQLLLDGWGVLCMHLHLCAGAREQLLLKLNLAAGLVEQLFLVAYLRLGLRHGLLLQALLVLYLGGTSAMCVGVCPPSGTGRVALRPRTCPRTCTPSSLQTGASQQREEWRKSFRMWLVHGFFFPVLNVKDAAWTHGCQVMGDHKLFAVLTSG